MKKGIKNTFVIFGAVALLTACAGPNASLDVPILMSDVTGFWGALVHGFFLLFSFAGSLLTDNISIYEVHNTGGWYDFGFLIGIVIWRFVWKEIWKSVDSIA